MSEPHFGQPVRKNNFNLPRRIRYHRRMLHRAWRTLSKMESMVVVQAWRYLPPELVSLEPGISLNRRRQALEMFENLATKTTPRL